MAVIQFLELWNNHPLNQNPSENFPCRKKDGSNGFENQCAIKLSIALMGAKLNMDSCTKVKCWYGHKNHVLRAQELADWLAGKQQLGAPTKFKKGKKESESDFQATVIGGVIAKPGIVFCRNFWGSGNQGDHIDVWSGMSMSGGFIHADYFGRSDQVWFWEITV